MEKTIFEFSLMDCPSEERLIRMKLEESEGIHQLEFNIPIRRVTVYHSGPATEIETALLSLNLGGKRISTETTTASAFETDTQQRKLLWTVLAINFGFFLIEMTTGLISQSMGLFADSLDMLADAFVYGLALFAVGSAATRKKKIAHIAGYLQIALAFLGFTEVLRRVFGAGELPHYATMIEISVLALLANTLCLYLLGKSKSKEEHHMKASVIFTSNDVIINLGVITAGLLVHWTRSNLPDLLIGTIVFLLVMRGALRILKL